jgi:hypothetical protein
MLNGSLSSLTIGYLMFDDTSHSLTIGYLMLDQQPTTNNQQAT